MQVDIRCQFSVNVISHLLPPLFKRMLVRVEDLDLARPIATPNGFCTTRGSAK